MNSHDELTYVYAVAIDTPRLRERLAGIRGISGSPVYLLHAEAPGTTADAGPESQETVAFVASRVAKQQFDEPTLKDHFEDLEWLESVARAHHEVVQATARHDTVLPLRLATVYQSDDRARQALSAQEAAFAERLALLRHQSELGVKLYLSPTGSPEPAGDSAADAADAVPLSPGKAYLRSRRAQHSAQEVRYDHARQAAERIESLASRFSTYRVRHPAQTGALAGPEENVLNDAYLVPDDRTDEFRDALTGAVEGLADVRVEVTGPWAPYSFAMPSAPAATATDATDPTATDATDPTDALTDEPSGAGEGRAP